MSAFGDAATANFWATLARLGRQQEKGPVVAGPIQERHENVSAILQPKGSARNPAMDIPLRKSRGFEEIHITPEIAQHWLSFNTSNRPIVQAKVEQYRKEVESGRWLDDGSTVRFAYGKLLDGQHRLTAVVLSGLKVRMLVVFGLDPSAQVVMDTGRIRTPKDVLSIEGLDSWEASTLGTAMHTIIAYDTGRALHSSMKFSNREVLDHYLEHQMRLDATLQACKPLPRRHPLMPLSRVMALHYVFAKKDLQQATAFFDSLMTGADLTKSSPIYHLRKILDDHAHTGKVCTAFYQMFLVVKAWNYCRRGTPLKSATSLYPRDSDTFPEVV